MEMTREGIMPCLVLHLGRADVRMTREGACALSSLLSAAVLRGPRFSGGPGQVSVKSSRGKQCP